MSNGSYGAGWHAAIRHAMKLGTVAVISAVTLGIGVGVVATKYLDKKMKQEDK